MLWKIVIAAGTIALALRTHASGRVAPSGYQVVRVYPHDAGAFTQGLEYADGVLYESTGLHGRSTLRKVRLESGQVMQCRDLDREYFGEGITLWRETIIQLTYQNEVGFVYDVTSFKEIGGFSYRGEGWGLTHDGVRLIMSDGSDTLRYLDPESLEEVGTLNVTDSGKPVAFLNELEFAHGEILANVWRTSRIARISATDGTVVGWIDLTGILDPADADGADVLNGIAYDEEKDRLFVTGKFWPKLFELKVEWPQ